MTQYPWPGNVRELENTLQRAVLVCLGQIIHTEDIERLLTKPFSGFPSSGFPSSGFPSSGFPSAHRALDIQTESSHGRAPAWSEQYKDLEEALGIPEKAILLGALRAHGWNRNATAQRLGINRTTLYKKMKRLGIECAN
jgi:DNA-binding NtrC family response regulator